MAESFIEYQSESILGRRRVKRMPQEVCAHLERQSMTYEEIMEIFLVYGVSSGNRLLDYAVEQKVIANLAKSSITNYLSSGLLHSHPASPLLRQGT